MRRLDAALTACGLALAVAVVWGAVPAETTVGDIAQGRARLARHPADEGAVRDLALAYEDAGQRASAEALMRHAGSFGWRDSRTQSWLMWRNFAERRYDAAFARATALMIRPVDDERRPRAISLMTLAAGDPRAAPALVRRLALAPYWRPPFLDHLGRSANTAAARGVLVALAAGPTPPTAEERAPYINRLVAAGRYGEAHADWMTLSRSAEAGLRDGGFDRASDGTPFTWQVSASAGVDAAIAPREDRPSDPALWVQGAARSEVPAARQLTALAPGAYALRWRVSGDPATARWRAVCAADGRVLGQDAGAGTGTAWRPGAMAIEVPPSGCAAQWIEAVATPGSGGGAAVWYDEVSLERAGGPALRR